MPCPERVKGSAPSAVTPTLSWADQSSECGLIIGKWCQKCVKHNTNRTDNVSEHIPNQFDVL